MMSHKAMKARHWYRIAEVTKCVLEVESDSFTLRTLMEAPLLECKEDIEVFIIIYVLNIYLDVIQFTKNLS